MSIRCLGAAGGAALGVWLGVTSAATAQVAPGWTLTRIVDASTTWPGADGGPSLLTPISTMTDGDSVVFSSLSGVYRWSAGTLEVVADTTTPLPGFDAAMSSFGMPYLDGGDVYFVAGGLVDGSGRTGVYRSSKGAIHVVADTSTPSPHGGTFVNFQAQTSSGADVRGQYVAVDHGRVAFGATESDRWGMYIASPEGEISTVADSITPFPETTVRIRDFVFPSIEGDDVVFASLGINDQGRRPQGVYARIAGSYVAMARRDMPAPGGGTFGNGLGTPEVHAGSILFFAYASGGPAIYRWSNGVLELVLNESSPFPGEASPVSDIPGFAFDRGRVAVVATGLFGDALFAQVNGAMRRVFDSAAPIDGRIVESLYIETTAFERRTLVFTAFFTDKTIGIYQVRPTCAADWNLDGAGDSQDFFDFLTAFFDGSADFNEDDATSSQDLFDFLDVFFAGCSE